MNIQLPDGWETIAQARRPQANSRRRDWYRIEAKADAPAEVYIYDEIGAWGTTAKAFTTELQAVTAKIVNLHLNTPGGDVFDGIAIHNALRNHPATVNVIVDSLAASIGSVIAMAGDTVTMGKHSTMMIHDPYGFAMGNASVMSKMAEVLDRLGDTIAGVYAEKAGGTVRQWRDRMAAESWYSDNEAVALGLADSIAGDEADTGKRAGFDLSIYDHPPAGLVGEPAKTEPTKRDIERALRDVGLSPRAAKALVSRIDGGEEADQRDAEELEALLDGLKILNF